MARQLATITESHERIITSVRNKKIMLLYARYPYVFNASKLCISLNFKTAVTFPFMILQLNIMEMNCSRWPEVFDHVKVKAIGAL